MLHETNVDPAEIEKFQSIASRWWDRESEFKPLHDINPLRVDYIERQSRGLSGKRVLDIGCGGGILAEALAQRGAGVTGIDMAEQSLKVARLHLHESDLEIDYQLSTAEAFADQHAAGFDVVTCLEMLEHVPDPAAIIDAAVRLLKPGGCLEMAAQLRANNMRVRDISGMSYNPLTRSYRLGRDIDVNYLVTAEFDA